MKTTFTAEEIVENLIRASENAPDWLDDATGGWTLAAVLGMPYDDLDQTPEQAAFAEYLYRHASETIAKLAAEEE